MKKMNHIHSPLGLYFFRKSTFSSRVFINSAIKFLKLHHDDLTSFSYVDSDPKLFNHLSVKDNILFESELIFNEQSKNYISKLSRKLGNPEVSKLESLIDLSSRPSHLSSNQVFLISLLKGIASLQDVLIIELPDRIDENLKQIIKQIIHMELVKGRTITLKDHDIDFWINLIKAQVKTSGESFELISPNLKILKSA